MRTLRQSLFLGLILAQAAHSIEEYYFRLYDVLAPARFISGLVSSNLALGFAIANGALVLLGLWCYLARVRKGHASALGWAWFWTILEAINGANHSKASADGAIRRPPSRPGHYSNQDAIALVDRRTVSRRSGPVETMPISAPTSSERRST